MEDMKPFFDKLASEADSSDSESSQRKRSTITVRQEESMKHLRNFLTNISPSCEDWWFQNFLVEPYNTDVLKLTLPYGDDIELSFFCFDNETLTVEMSKIDRITLKTIFKTSRELNLSNIVGEPSGVAIRSLAKTVKSVEDRLNRDMSEAEYKKEHEILTSPLSTLESIALQYLLADPSVHNNPFKNNSEFDSAFDFARQFLHRSRG